LQKIAADGEAQFVWFARVGLEHAAPGALDPLWLLVDHAVIFFRLSSFWEQKERLSRVNS
jgi:hypothetical protein